MKVWGKILDKLALYVSETGLKRGLVLGQS